MRTRTPRRAAAREPRRSARSASSSSCSSWRSSRSSTTCRSSTPTASPTTRTTSGDARATSPSPRARSSPATAPCSPGRCRSTTSSSSSASTRWARCSATSAGYQSLHAREHRRRRRRTTDDLTRPRRRPAVQDLGDLLIGNEPTGNVVAHAQHATAQQAASDALGDRRGLGGGARPEDRRRSLAHVLEPVLRPEPAGESTTARPCRSPSTPRQRSRPTRCWPAPTASAIRRARRSRWSPPRSRSRPAS